MIPALSGEHRVLALDWPKQGSSRPWTGGSFYLGIAVQGTATGVDWDVCAKTTDVAATILTRLP